MTATAEGQERHGDTPAEVLFEEENTSAGVTLWHFPHKGRKKRVVASLPMRSARMPYTSPESVSFSETPVLSALLTPPNALTAHNALQRVYESRRIICVMSTRYSHIYA
jgi:hypothetical protein